MDVLEVRIESSVRGEDGLSLRAMPWSGGVGVDYYDGPDIQVELRVGGLVAIAELPAYVADAERLVPLFRAIDQDWKGWDGTKRTGDVADDWLAVEATHDGKGHVTLKVALGHGWPGQTEWSVRGLLEIEVGSARRHADSIETWIAAIWPAEYQYGIARSTQIPSD
jgi:hypothetical protein